ncbi:lipoprotein LpqH [Mycobacterium paraterrae]|uniref:Lipoprotein LpqH n=1 Tax=Mycobacterium paraterrae TaxID=577492 RepID=A0ABY3VR28_9MYCO|nr:lipoprotein LpqH [Mycobacterium paraterrae]UMB69954.1 lipoprotein LpqH [Mycobacterium paraterrae]
MDKSVCTVAAAMLIVSGCASGQASTPGPGALPPGTAKISIDGGQVGSTYSVRCQTVDWMTRIHTDLHGATVNAMLSNAGKLTAEFVRLHDVDGFEGSYERALQGEASVTMNGATYQITGAALGFNKSDRTRLKAETFTLTVSC